MEHAFDFDFSGVRVHQGGLADTLCVPACACGSDLYFAADRYRPDDPAGQALLAHELAHVVQQQTGQVSNPFGTGMAVLVDTVLEAAADRCAAWAVRGKRVPGFESHSAHPARAAGLAFLLAHAEPRWDGPPRVLQCDDGVGEDNNAPATNEHPWSVVRNARDYGHRLNAPNRHQTAKKIGTVAMRVGQAASTTAQHVQIGATGMHFALAGAASGAAIGATGIGAIAVGGALALGVAGLNARSAYKTSKHIENLQTIQRNSGDYFCKMLPARGNVPNLHDTIRDTVLPYIISQKQEKRVKKGVGAVPVAGSATTVLHRIGRGIYKSLRSTRGKRRNLYAEFLAVHLLTAECQLVDAIIRELLSEDVLEWMKQPGQTNNTIGGLIAEKMKSF
jgi:hypothetical protein